MVFAKLLLLVPITLYTLLLSFVYLILSDNLPMDLSAIQSMFLFLPYWLLYLPLVLAIPITFVLYRNLAFILVTVAVLNFFQISESYVWSNSNEIAPPSSENIRILSFNMGGSRDLEAIKSYIEKIKPDIMIIQETRDFRVEKITASNWSIHCAKLLCTASRFPLKFKQKFTRENPKKGGFAGINHEITLKPTNAVSEQGTGDKINDRAISKTAKDKDSEPRGIVLSVFNVHLDTPRKAIEALLQLNKSTDHILNNNYLYRAKESDKITQALKMQDNIIVAGDFNMTVNDPIYRKYWSQYQNAFSSTGSGFGFTKYTSWHGIRIDHILLQSKFKIQQTFVGPSFGGDHRPVIADISL